VTRDGFAAAAAVSPAYAYADPRIANGCVPLDPFGTNPIPQAAHDYAFGFLDEKLDYTQQVVAFDASGDIWKGMSGGPFQLAAGAEYRTELGHNIGSQDGAPDYVRTDYLIQYGESFSGKVDVTEAFAELNTPLLRDKPGASRLEFNTAVRESNYQNTGHAKGLQFAVDAFDIKITDAIQQANIRRVLDGCQISNLPEFCALIVPDVPGDYQYNPATNTGVASIRALAFNGSAYTYKGFDVTGNYRVDFTGSSLNFRLLATHMTEQLFQPVPGQPFVNVVGQTGTSNSFLSDYQPTADWVANFATTYSRNRATVTGQVRWVSSGVMNYYGITPGDPGYATAALPLVTMSDNGVPAYSVFNLAGSYDFKIKGSTLQFFAVNNVFDKNPPVAAGAGFGGNGNGGTNPVFFDALGRSYRVGIRATF